MKRHSLASFWGARIFILAARSLSSPHSLTYKEAALVLKCAASEAWKCSDRDCTGLEKNVWTCKLDPGRECVQSSARIDHVLPWVDFDYEAFTIMPFPSLIQFPHYSFCFVPLLSRFLSMFQFQIQMPSTQITTTPEHCTHPQCHTNKTEYHNKTKCVRYLCHHNQN
jgi:hypothetical protein